MQKWRVYRDTRVILLLVVWVSLIMGRHAFRAYPFADARRKYIQCM